MTTVTFDTILQFATQNHLILPFTFNSVIRNLDWVSSLFPSDDNHYQLYITNEDPIKLKTKYIIYHSLLEIYYFHNNGLHSQLKHRKLVFDKVLYFKHKFTYTHILTYSVTQKPLDYYKQFNNHMFNVVGI